VSPATAEHGAFVVGGIRIDALPLASAIEAVLDRSSAPASVHLCNAYTIAAASRDESLRRHLEGGTLNLSDGMPLVWIARHLGLEGLTERVYGPHLMAGALDRGRATGTRHYFYGSSPEVLDQLRRAVAARWPGVEVAGTESPPFDRTPTDEDLAGSVRAMEEVGSDLVWVGMGTPKQDHLVERLKAVGPHTYVAIGAAFDFIAGTKPQAPRWLQAAGLEWLFRLASEPRRLWRRYLFGNARFLWLVARSRPHLLGAGPRR
jgi:N-acetylglucosaminyldiphosphoundecaprenol N-acetyl-beta-D-mannosaminyltransferase